MIISGVRPKFSENSNSTIKAELMSNDDLSNKSMLSSSKVDYNNLLK